MHFEKNILLTGAAGFIGSHVARFMVNNYPKYRIVVLDKLTYAGDLKNIEDLNDKPNFVFIKGDITDASLVNSIFNEQQISSVMHLAAESHVDRSIENPMEFVYTNVVGTVTLLNAAIKAWGEHADRNKHLFYHISTDEVYGSLGSEGYFTEETPYDPRSPYSASKASSDHFVRAYHHTFGLPVVISNCSNNYGPNQYPEKLIPVVIRQIIENRPIPVYGKGENIRDWLFVGDHVSAIDVIYHTGKNGETYNVGGNNEWKNIELVEKLCDILDQKLNRPQGEARKLISFVVDRKGHDLRYAIDASKLKDELHWEPKQQFDSFLAETVAYYLQLFKTKSTDEK